MKKNILKNIINISISNIIKLLSGVLVGFLLPKIIGITDYGYYKTFTLYSTYVGLFAIGITDGIYLKYGGLDYSSIDKREFRFYSRFYFFIEILFTLLLVIFSVFLLNGEYRFIILCLSFYLLFNNITGYFQIISQITSRFKEFSSRNIIQSFLIAISIFVLLLLNKYCNYIVTYKIYMIIYINIIAFLSLWYIYTYRDIVFGKEIRISNKKSLIISIIKIGIPLLISNLCSSLILSIDRQFVSILFDTETYAIYAFAYNMLGLITTAFVAISTVIYPTMKKTNKETLGKNYSFFVSVILIISFLCLICYFPLNWFVNWFLPKYSNSLPIFRVIMPGLAVSSVITIVMHNYYKTEGKEIMFFVKSIIILAISCVANFVAYFLFKSTISISIASIFVMYIWYVLMEEYFIRSYKVKWIKNLIYMLLMTFGFYLITCWELWWASMLVYSVYMIIVTIFFYYKDFCRFLKN